ncbi:hypothetical protein HNV08_04975 [Winogradskyella eckloniae]|uniref:hypothetical protein n=1 Tax=Winogradskyella eckloniae TaxID=1089306 RepID=UPI001566CD88|nr:hypothetical protein [Winogradskyella eckloniae]NRD19391.1 hypothetical protein [Winogradskyella eckloniae]
MAPIKFEENVKDKLEKRTLSPSQDGWSKLSNRLDEDQHTSKKPLYWWLSIAAGILLMMAVAIQFFNKADSEKQLPQIVNEDSINGQIQQDKTQPNAHKLIELVEQDKTEEKNLETLPELISDNRIDYKKVTKEKSMSGTKVASHNAIQKDLNTTIHTDEINKPKQNVIDTAMLQEAMVVAMQELKNEQAEVSDRELDSLLKIASKELFKNNLHIESVKITDAETLLLRAEEEMGQSFRTKVFEALKDSYNSVKTAVADRNN